MKTMKKVFMTAMAVMMAASMAACGLSKYITTGVAEPFKNKITACLVFCGVPNC